MKKLILILFILASYIGLAQDPPPATPPAVRLQTPNNPTFWYDPLDSLVWIYKGSYGWTKLASDTLLKKYYVPYINARKDVNLGDKNIQSSKQQLPVDIGIVVPPTIDRNVDGTVTVHGDGIVTFNSLVNGRGYNVRLACTNDTTLTLVSGGVSFIYVDYNNGNPKYGVLTDNYEFINNTTIIPITRATKISNTSIHFEEYDEFGTHLSYKLMLKDIYINAFERYSGLILSTATNRISTISAGIAWFGVQYYDMVDNIAGSSGLLYEYYLTGGVWSSTLVTSYDASYYSDGTNRQLLGNNKYVSKYFFRDVGSDNEAYYIHGGAYNTLAEARAELMPTPPSLVVSHSIYVGKIVIQKDALDGVAFPRVWEGQVQSATSTSHTDLTASSLVWTASGHTGDNNTIAVFNNEGVASTIIDSSAFWNNHLRQDKDTSTTNEIQTLSTNGTAGNISISGGNTITLNVNDADYSPANELQNLTYQRYSDKGIMNISSGNSDTIPIVDDTYAGLMTPEQKAKLDSTVSNSNPLFYVEGDLQANIIYGYLYNWYAATDTRKISSSDDWDVPSWVDFYNLMIYIDPDGTIGSNTAGGALKETGFTHWNSPNEGATNSTEFRGVGSGIREIFGVFPQFFNLKEAAVFWNKEEDINFNSFAYVSALEYSTDYFNTSIGTEFGEYASSSKINGLSLRLIKTATGVIDGTITIYIGNDGKTYSAIAINGLYWLQYNLAETKYRNGDPIPTVEDNTAWAGLTTGARCSYDNDEANALTIVNGATPIYQGDSTNFTTPEILSDSLDNYWSKEEILPIDTVKWNNKIDSLFSVNQNKWLSNLDSINIDTTNIPGLKEFVENNGVTQEIDPVYAADSSNIVWFSDLTDSLNIIRDTLNLHLDTLQSHNQRLLMVEGLDTTGIYHINRSILDAITATDTAKWAEDNQQISIDSIGRVFIISLERGGSIKFEDTNTTYDLSQYQQYSDTTSWDATKADLIAGLATKEPANVNIQQHITNDADLSPTNEIQSLSWNGANGELSISSSNTVDLDGRYLQSFTETDPVYSSDSTEIFYRLVNIENDTTLWNNTADSIPELRSDINANLDSINIFRLLIDANTGKDTTGIYHANRTALDSVSGVNTGDQDLSGFVEYSDTLSVIETKANAAVTYQTKLTNPVTGTGTTNYLPKFTGASTLGNSLIYDNGTNVGIGTNSPNEQLELTKNFRLPLTTYNSGNPYGIIYKGTIPFIHDFNYGNNGTVTTRGYNLFIGNSGNFTMGSTATSQYQSSYNIGIGNISLGSLTTGRNNTAIGISSLYGLTTGANNTAVGIAAGSYYDSENYFNVTNANSSVFLGPDTRPLADNGYNEIVIGFNTDGHGPNTATIGNNDLLRTYLSGVNLRAGTNSNAPLVMNSGSNLLSPQTGAFEFNGSRLFFTPSSTRETVAFLSDIDTSKINLAYNNQITSLGVTGATTKTITATQQDGGTITTNFTDLVNDADSDPTNELITSVTYLDDSLKITEAGITHKVKIEAGGATNVVDAYSNKIAVSNSTVSVNWPTAFSNTNYFLLINAYYEEIINGKNIRVENAVYDFSKTVNGFSLKVDTVMGYVEYFAADTTNLYPLAFDNYLAESDSLIKYVTPNQLSDSLSNVVISETDPIFTSDSTNIVYWSDTTSIIETKAHTTATYQPKGSYLTSEVDGSVENEGKLSIVAGGTNAAIIKSNTANSDSVVVVGSSGVTIAVSNDTINVSSTGGSGGASLLDLVGYQQGGWSASGNSSTSVNVWGMLTGFTAVDASSSFVGGTYGPYLRQNTSNTSGNDATIGTSSSPFIFASSYPLLSVKFALISYASSDFYAGFKTTPEDGYVATAEMIGLYFNSGDSEFKFVTGNGTSTTVTGTGVSLSTDVYILVIDVSPTLVTFYLYDYNYSLLSSATHTTNIPTNSLGVFSDIETQTSSARSIAQYSGNIKLRK